MQIKGDTMIIVEHILGNIHKDAILAQKIKDAVLDILVFNQWEAQKSRCRKRTQKGRDIGIILDRDHFFQEGDVLFFEASTNTYVIAKITLSDLMVVDLNSLKTKTTEKQIKISFELGHTLGNQHWKAVIKGNSVYVPINVSQSAIHALMKAHHFDQNTYQFVNGNTVFSIFSTAEARLLFGGTENTKMHVHVTTPHDHLLHIQTK